MKERAKRELIARRVAREIDSGQVVHLGEGLPAILFDQVPQKQGVMFYSDNGVMGYGPRTSRGGGNPDLVDYAGGTISLVPGGSIMHEADSLGMVRGGCGCRGAVPGLGAGTYGRSHIVRPSQGSSG